MTPTPDPDMSALGPCCICEGTDQVHVILLLNARAPIAGHGWGCVQCGVPSNGAMAVLCEMCAARYEAGEQGHVERDLRFVCRGYPASEGRLPIADLRGEHGHDRRKHPEIEPIPPLTIVPSDTRFATHVEEGQGCLCSRCGLTIWEGVLAVRAWPQTGDWAYRFHPTCFGATPIDEDPYAEDPYADNPL